jgi:uncharacterized protein (DUF983 family)
MEPSPRKRWWMLALLLLRCPRCRLGRIFDGIFSMKRSCSVCDLKFRTEEGFWLGAMYFGYGLAVLIVVPLFYLFSWLFPNWSGILVALVAVLPYIPLSPIVFRYSRGAWIYVEYFVDPHQLTSR